MKTVSSGSRSKLLFSFAIIYFACNKTFDAPPPYLPPDLAPTLTIAQLKAQHVFGSVELISTDDIIEGVVTANDSSGNFINRSSYRIPAEASP
jgi:hypothetical protein